MLQFINKILNINNLVLKYTRTKIQINEKYGDNINFLDTRFCRQWQLSFRRGMLLLTAGYNRMQSIFATFQAGAKLIMIPY